MIAVSDHNKETCCKIDRVEFIALFPVGQQTVNRSNTTSTGGEMKYEVPYRWGKGKWQEPVGPPVDATRS